MCIRDRRFRPRTAAPERPAPALGGGGRPSLAASAEVAGVPAATLTPKNSSSKSILNECDLQLTI
eukprot:11221634-Alexandrium_andersonii.AAC.1